MEPLFNSSAVSDQLFMGSVFIAGFLSFFAPCTFPMLPVYFGILSDKAGARVYKVFGLSLSLYPMMKTLMFVLGLSTTFVTLGFGFGAFGTFINSSVFTLVSGGLVILLGLHQMELLKLPGASKYKVLRLKRSGKEDLLGAYLLGLTFSFGWTPCVGPVLGAVLVVAADGGHAMQGAFLMGLYSMGLMIPFLIMTLFMDLLLNQFQKLETHLGLIKKIGGALIVLMGILLMTNQMTTLTAWFNRLFL